MRNFIFFIFISLLLGCTPKIQSIVQYKKVDNEFVISKISEFDKHGNNTREVNFGNARSNRNIITEIKNNRRSSQKTCDDFKRADTCMIRSFSVFQYDAKTQIEKEIKYEPDSSIRFIRVIMSRKNLQIKKIHSWEFRPTKNPAYEKAMVLIDTTFLDKLGRKKKSLHYRIGGGKPWIELFQYDNDGYSVQTKGTFRDTIINIRTTPLQKLIHKRKMDYVFFKSDQLKYEVKYY